MADNIFDPDNPAHAKALGMLDRDLIAWITTLGSDGSPRAVPVWFLWHDGTISILSEPVSHKVTHIRSDPRVLVHLHAGGPTGDDVVVLRGTATLTPDGAAGWIERFREPYTAKYAESIAAFGIPAEALAQKFSTLIEFRPRHLLAW
ncbi:pyridoxamine 5'-phosphate oxidase family protein [Microbacterium sp. DT81.1]|uniref:pyridoxamine 5'-phosphate oxidase family protein n=1 Tax=Microbacterium sp. DT81.1 TaxID=3393413 RepID=UPI003CE745D8